MTSITAIVQFKGNPLRVDAEVLVVCRAGLKSESQRNRSIRPQQSMDVWR